MRREWDEEEIDCLKEYIGYYKIPTIAKKMDRSYEAIRTKLNRLGLANTKNHTGLLTVGELAKILQVDRNTIKGWIKRHNLPYVKKVTRKVRSFYFIDPTEFWEWAEQNKEKIQFSKIESQVLLPEPDWVEKERWKERKNEIVKKRPYKYWTTGEDMKLMELRQKNYTFKEIARILDRTPTSVARRYSRMTKH